MPPVAPVAPVPSVHRCIRCVRGVRGASRYFGTSVLRSSASVSVSVSVSVRSCSIVSGDWHLLSLSGWCRLVSLGVFRSEPALPTEARGQGLTGERAGRSRSVAYGQASGQAGLAGVRFGSRQFTLPDAFFPRFASFRSLPSRAFAVSPVRFTRLSRFRQRPISSTPCPACCSGQSAHFGGV